jgi:hypothetical protein
MYREKTVDIDVFQCNLHILVADDFNRCIDGKRLRKYCSGEPDEDLSEDTAFVFQKKKSDYYVIVAPDASCGTVAHEAVHLVNRIFADRGQDADCRNDEVFAYHVGWFVRLMSSFICKIRTQFDGGKQV